MGVISKSFVWVEMLYQRYTKVWIANLYHCLVYFIIPTSVKFALGFFKFDLKHVVTTRFFTVRNTLFLWVD